MTLHLASGLELPANAVTQKFAFIGRSGSGKTYAAGKLVEELLGANAQVVVLDPVGNWYGLRLAADGKSSGIDIPVIGGAHGDLPLDPAAGPAIARLIVDEYVSVVIDVSNFRKHQRKQFVTEFAEELYHQKKSARSPVHVLIEEAQVFVPQHVARGEEAMLGALEDICRLGRNYGIGTTLISQRPQSVNKEVLNQVECLVVLQTNGPHERKAIEGWVVEKGLDKKIVDELPGLAIGEAFVWSPQWLKILKRVKIGKKRTFDASETPKLGTKSVSRELTPVRLDMIRKALEASVKAAEENDPKTLRKRVAQLAAEAAALKAQPRERVETPVLTEADRKLLQRTIDALVKRADAATAEAQKLEEIFKSLDERQQIHRRMAARHAVEETAATRRRTILAERGDPNGVNQPGGPTNAYQQSIINALARFYVLGRVMVDRKHVAAMAGKSPRSSAFDAALAKMRAAMLVTYGDNGAVGITVAGLQHADRVAEPATTGELIAAYRDHVLSAYEWKLLSVLVKRNGHVTSREMLAVESGLSMRSSAFDAALASMRKLGVVEYVQGQGVKASSSMLEAVE